MPLQTASPPPPGDPHWGWTSPRTQVRDTNGRGSSRGWGGAGQTLIAYENKLLVYQYFFKWSLLMKRIFGRFEMIAAEASCNLREEISWEDLEKKT